MIHKIDPQSCLETHEVENQPVMDGPRDLWSDDRALVQWTTRMGGDAGPLATYGAALGGAELQAAGRAANRFPPELVSFDRAGRRLDELSFHPAYHTQMRAGLAAGYAALPWEGAAGGHVSHAAMVYLLSQVDPGVCCPLTMTYAGIATLRGHGGVAGAWAAKLQSREYDPAVCAMAEKSGATLGMAMTEKQGGSDVRANTTRAQPDGDGWRLTGHKWFCSAPMSDGFLTLAQGPDGLTCYLVPRWLPDGTRNAIHLMRLKEKLGNKSNGSAEIEYHNAFAHQIGGAGDGVRTIIQMVHHTRLDTAMAPAGLMRAALAQAVQWCQGRSAFQKRLIDAPLMRAVLADLSLDAEGALALGLRVAAAFDRDEPLARVAVSLAKYLSNKLATGVIYEAMEALGGVGYTDDTPLPMLFREAPLNSIWEGSGNVICLDILRTLARDAVSAQALTAELQAASGLNGDYDAALARHLARWPGLPDEAEARWFAESLATLLTAGVLLQQGDGAVAEAYAATRLGTARGRTAGAIGAFDVSPLIDRLTP